jgi:CheY-like chemotaxis protein
VTTAPADASKLPLKADETVDVVYVNDCSSAAELMREQKFDGVYYGGQCLDAMAQQKYSAFDLLQNSEIVDWVPDGIALLDGQNTIVKSNQRLTSWFEGSNLVGLEFYEAIGKPDVVGDEPTPLSAARSKKQPCTSTLKHGDRFFKIAVVPILSPDQNCDRLLVTLTDYTENVLQQEKMEALHRAGTALADLRPEEIYQMDVDERIDLLKDNILHYTKDLLEFDVIDIRMLDRKTGLLVPLLSEGIDAQASQAPMYAKAEDNGVTGFVVATGQSYLCEDTTHDPLYRDGMVGAKSSLTVPLIYHDEVVGSFNVERPEINAFNNNDLHFLESFARDIAVSLNTLELLNAQRTDAALQSIHAIHDAVVMPINEILNDTVHAIESYIGHDPDVTRRLRTILAHARQIKKAIHEVGEELAPNAAVPACVKSEIRPALKDKCILVIDADEQVRKSADQLLGRYGCDVETAHEGEEALMMVRNCGYANGYDAIIADIRLPDIGGYDLLMKLKELVNDPPLILMTGFGYDPGHSIVKARQAGLKKNAVLFKPFRIDQLVAVVEAVAMGEEPKTAELRSGG